ISLPAASRRHGPTSANAAWEPPIGLRGILAEPCRRTWTSCARSTRPGNAATSARPSGRIAISSTCKSTDRRLAGGWGLQDWQKVRPHGSTRVEGFRIEAEDFRELDDERILVLSKGSGRGRASGLDLGQLTRSAPDL